jgi:hypothetical protein
MGGTRGRFMIDVTAERVFPLSHAPRHLPQGRRGKRIHVATPYRWASSGIRGADGAHVVLETIRVGGTLYTSLEALQEFCQRLTGVGRPAHQPETSARRNDRAERAGRECERLGL